MKTATILLIFTFALQLNAANCNRVISAAEDPTAAQITGNILPTIPGQLNWVQPAISTSKVAFAGTAGLAASHEGIDFVHNDQAVEVVDVYAAADGKVVYVREGCEQSSMFAHNNIARESGAGWGNHIVIEHKGVVFTRYGHLLKNSILVNVGDSVKAGQKIAIMGNSGRSETRHLHFELGTKASLFNSCEMSQNFDFVYNGNLVLGSAPVNNTIVLASPTNNASFLSKKSGKYVIYNNGANELKSLQVFDIAGKMLLKMNLSNYENSFILAQKGIFILNITGHNLSLTQKIIN